MIAAPLKLTFDINRLREHVEKYVIPLEPIRQSNSFGGWSVLSSDGTYKDGWHMGHVLIEKESRTEDINKGLAEMGARPSAEYVYPTEICHGYLLEVIEEIKKLGFRPRRARIIRLSSGLASSWHRDSPEHSRFVRLHVPIITNADCFFEIEGDKEHLPATGQAYLLRVNRLHRVVNRGPEDRYHLVMDVDDENCECQAP